MLAFMLSLCDESDRDKIEYLYNTYQKRMLGLAMSLLRDVGDTVYEAENAVAEAFLKIVAYPERIDFARGEESVRRYLFSIVRNEAYNILRRYGEECDVVPYDECLDGAFTDEDFIKRMCARAEYEHIVGAIRSLSGTYRIVLYMRFVGELSPSEIAARLGVPMKTVYTTISRGKALLVSRLNEHKNGR